MTNEEAKIFLDCNSSDFDCYENEIFQNKQKLLASYQHHRIIKKTSEQLINKHGAALAFGFNEPNQIDLSGFLFSSNEIIQISDILELYREFELIQSKIKLAISNSKSFFELHVYTYAWVELIQNRMNRIFTDVISPFQFSPMQDIKRSSPFNSGEIILELKEIDPKTKINQESLTLLVNSNYIYEDLSRIYLEHQT